MHDYGPLVYLDLQKTGSSYVSRFLRFSCLLNEKKFEKHACIREDFNEDTSYFITVRNPLTLYSSLYRYGLDRRGGVFNRLRKRGLESTYKSFERFFEFCFSPKNAESLGSGYNKKIAKQIGFVSFRYLRLSLQYPNKKINAQLNKGKALVDLKSDFITSHIFKNDVLNDELLRLSTELYPQYFDVDKATDFLNSKPRVNASRTQHKDLSLDSSELLKIMESKESLLWSLYK